MVLKRRAELAATSRADDLALRALAEIVEIAGDENIRIVGGQMVSLLLAAFPWPGIAARRTRGADAAITTEPPTPASTTGWSRAGGLPVRATTMSAGA